uniref:thymidine kinase n=1 Tax=viral metagenome TaxID=1070528 RepID=A0A6C0I591_9ZZZZ
MSLHLIMGPMFSGKTTRLLNLYKTCREEGKDVYVINYIGDKRYHETLLSTHDEEMIPCDSSVQTLADAWPNHVIAPIHHADVILINEGQFFPDLVPIVKTMVEEFGKVVYVSGLDGDYKRETFGSMLQLVPISDSVEKLLSKCHLCPESKAPFSHRLTAEQQQVVIGSTNYIPLCRKCYRQMNF